MRQHFYSSLLLVLGTGSLLAGAAPSLGRIGHRAVSRHQDARDSGRSTGIGPHPYFNSMGRSHPPAAMVGRLAKGIGDYITRFRSGTHQLFVNAKKIGPLRKRMGKGEELSFEEYNLLQRTSGDLAKAVGLTVFTMTKPELAPIMMSFFPQVIPSTYLTADDKVRRAQNNYFQRVKAAVEHVLSLEQEAVSLKRKDGGMSVSCVVSSDDDSTLDGILRAYNKGNLAAGLKHVEGVLYGEKESPKKADLRAVPRPFLVFACKSVGMFHRFVPAFGIRFLLGDYLHKIRESDAVLQRSDLTKVPKEDLMEACSQRSLSLGDMSEASMRKAIKDYLAIVTRPPLDAAKKADGAGYLNEQNVRFALLSLNVIAVVRESPENRALQALFG